MKNIAILTSNQKDYTRMIDAIKTELKDAIQVSFIDNIEELQDEHLLIAEASMELFNFKKLNKPIVIVLDKKVNSMVVKFYEMGATDCIFKPFNKVNSIIISKKIVRHLTQMKDVNNLEIVS